MIGPADPGLQPERTALAWRRTALALVGLSLGSARVTWQLVGGWSLLLSGAGAAVGAWLMLHAHARYERHSSSITGGGAVADGVAPFVTAGLAFAIGLAGVAFLIVAAR